MSDAAEQRALLEKKDKGALAEMVIQLGGAVTPRTKKADMVDAVMSLTTGGEQGGAPADAAKAESAGTSARQPTGGASGAGGGPNGDGGNSSGSNSGSNNGGSNNSGAAKSNRNRNRKRRNGPSGEPLAEWELELMESEGDSDDAPAPSDRPADPGNEAVKEKPQDDEAGNRRRRRRGRNRDRDDAPDQPPNDPVPMSGYLDLRDDGYGFCRAKGHISSRSDVYVPVKLVRQFGLRRGDHLVGTSRPASRNEKNPALHELLEVNGMPADTAAGRPEFEDLTPLFPDERLVMERAGDHRHGLTTRIIDLIAPIGKGQRALVVSPPKAGKTTVLVDIAKSIEQNHDEVTLMVLLVDERPEEVTQMRRALDRGEVLASTFDRPAEEHCAVAELTIERAKRLVESGQDVVLIVDGITRLTRAYNMDAPNGGRIMSGGIDASAIYPPKKFFGAARNLEEGGSLTIIATALVETGSRMDEVIFEEFKGTGNCELRLDRQLAEKRIFPAVDIAGSGTRHEELLFDGRTATLVDKMRRVLAGIAGGEDAAPGAATELLIDRLKTFESNADFLTEIAKAK